MVPADGYSVNICTRVYLYGKGFATLTGDNLQYCAEGCVPCQKLYL